MFSTPPANDDFSKLLLIPESGLEWQRTAFSGVLQKLFDCVVDKDKTRQNSLLKFEPGTMLPQITMAYRTDFFVLRGAISDGYELYDEGVFVRSPQGTGATFKSEPGCELFCRVRNDTGRVKTRLVRDAKVEQNWQPWGDRGFMRIPISLGEEDLEPCWIGMAYPNLQIPDHDHVGGEEVFMFSGYMDDANGRIDTGSWVRIPDGLRHAPRVGHAGCKMLVWEGDVPR